MNNLKSFSLPSFLLLFLSLTFFSCKQDSNTVDNTLKLEAATLPPLFEKTNYTPNYYHVNPYELLKLWGEKPLDKSLYSQKDIETQQKINEKTTDGIMTYSPIDKEIEWTEIDEEEITPYTWKWADFELLQVDGTLTTAKLRRPNWWLKKHNATKEGDSVYLDIPELGSKGWAKLKKIRVNQLDTRFWKEHRKGDYLSRPITGKFTHEADDVYYLTFSGDKKPLGVTGGHWIWSEDRKDWIPATQLKIGEHVRTMTGSGLATLKKKVKDNKGFQKVYNLEVYRDHNFQVAKQGILVHNSCADDVVNSAGRIVKGKTSRGTQALSKKIGRGDAAYAGLKANQETADKIIKDVMNSSDRIDVPNRNQQGIEIIDYFNPNTKQGVRVIKETGEFDTFVTHN